MRKIKIGTRKSKLAIRQTEIVTGLIKSRFPQLQLEIIPLSTLGDRLPLEKRAETEGKAAFTEEIEASLMEGTIDVAIHSMKDIPNKIHKGLTIGATPVRADPRDVLVSQSGRAFGELRSGAMIGTSSLRRKAQLLSMRRDISVVDLHGNVDTRLSKIGHSGIDGIVIAAAGLERLGESRRITQYFTLAEMVPAPAQGAIAVEIRKDDDQMANIVLAIDNRDVRAETTSERAFATALGLDCDVPAGACASLKKNELRLTGSIASLDGREIIRGSLVSDRRGAEKLGRQLAAQLLQNGGEKILRGMTP